MDEFKREICLPDTLRIVGQNKQSKVPLLSWLQKRKRKKQLKRQAEISKSVATELEKAKMADDKKMNVMCQKQACLQERLNFYTNENQSYKDCIQYLEKKVSKLQTSLFKQSVWYAEQSNKLASLINAETQTNNEYNEILPEDLMCTRIAISELESMKTKVMSLEFTVFRQRKLMELMEETLRIYEPTFLLNPLTTKL